MIRRPGCPIPLLASLVLLAIWLGPRSAAAQDAFAALRDGAIGLMRHGGAIVAPSGAPPPLPGCLPTAVLTEAGREEMRRWGQRLHNEGVRAARVFVSRQCSAYETAQLLALGEAQHDPALDPLVDGPERESGAAALLRSMTRSAATSRGGGDARPTLFITHRANISAVTGIELLQGEILVLQPRPGGGFALVGRLSVD